MCEGSKSKEVTSEDIKKLSIKKITSSNLFYFAGCFFFEMGREFKKNSLSSVLFNRLQILHIVPVGLISKKESNLACAAHFFYISLTLFRTIITWKFLVTHLTCV